METDVTLELVIDSKDEQTLRAIEQALGGVDPQRWPETRDVMTIITVASSTVALVNALLDLRSKLAKKGTPAPSVVIKNVNRMELALPEASKETLEALILDGRTDSFG